MNRTRYTVIATVLLLVPLAALHAADAPPVQRPNILLITAEDICPNLGCYGDPNAVTPNLDRFADAGRAVQQLLLGSSLLFAQSFRPRHGRVSDAARHLPTPRQNVGEPGIGEMFPDPAAHRRLLLFQRQQRGQAKLDYEFDPKDHPWDKIGSKEIEWRHRAAGQPFFGQINIFCTHQSRYGQRPPGGKTVNPVLYGGEPSAERVHDPAKIVVPPYLPDTPAVREIWAEYHDRITQMDGQFAVLLKMLADDGLADDTIIFFIGDNGHGVPSGKVWLWDEGPHVPLIVRIPKNWAGLASGQPGVVSDRLVSFVDFAPTMLSLAGVPIPGDMQGSDFLGPKSGEPRRYVYAARRFSRRRGLRHLPHGARRAVLLPPQLHAADWLGRHPIQLAESALHA